jgi:hypothetical protein
MFNEVTISKALLGKTLTEVTGSVQSEEIIFTTDTGDKYKMYHRQDCCESVYVETSLVICRIWLVIPFSSADESTGKMTSRMVTVNHHTWTFYRLATIRGSVVIRWYGSSNGYYSETVDIIKL